MTNTENTLSQQFSNNNPDLEKSNTEKAIQQAGKFSIATAVISFILTIIANIRNYGFIDSLLNALFFSPLLIPFLYFGIRLTKTGMDKLDSAYKISKGMLIYTIFFVAWNTLKGGFGLLWLLLVYFFYKSYVATARPKGEQ